MGYRQAAIAKDLGVSRQLVGQYVKEGRYNENVDAWLKEHSCPSDLLVQPKERGRPMSDKSLYRKVIKRVEELTLEKGYATSSDEFMLDCPISQVRGYLCYAVRDGDLVKLHSGVYAHPEALAEFRKIVEKGRVEK